MLVGIVVIGHTVAPACLMVKSQGSISAAMPAERLLGIELNDGPAESSLDFVMEATDHRLLCGQGEWDVKGFVKTMLDAGYGGAWGVEILSTTQRVLPVDEMAKRAYDTAIVQFP